MPIPRRRGRVRRRPSPTGENSLLPEKWKPWPEKRKPLSRCGPLRAPAQPTDKQAGKEQPDAEESRPTEARIVAGPARGWHFQERPNRDPRQSGSR